MPLQLTPGDRKILLIAAGVFLLMIGTSVLLTRGSGSEQEAPSTYSTASGGARAAYLLLKESGYQTDTWEQPLRELPEGKGKTLVIADPANLPAQEDRQRLEKFLRSGGRLIVAGRFAAFGLPLNESAPDPFVGTEWKRFPALSPSAITRAAPEITLGPEAVWHPGTGAVALYGEAEKPVVVEYKIGEGEVLWLAAATPLTNAGLKETGNLEFLLAAVRDPAQSQVLWDEYVHGYQHSSPSSASSRVIGWIALQFGVFAAAILLAYSRRSGPVWVPENEARLSPLEFVRTLGSLYEHANAGAVAVEIYYQRFRFLLTRRLGLSVNASVVDMDRAVQQRWALHEDGFANTLRECESCRYDPNIPPSTTLRLVQALFDYAQRLELTASPRKEKAAWKL